MFKKNKYLISCLLSSCLSSFAPGPEIGYFNKAVQFNKYAYYGVQQFCAYRFASSGIRRMNYFHKLSYRQSHYHQGTYMLVQNRNMTEVLDPLLVSAATLSLLSGLYSVPLMIIGGAGTFFWAKSRFDEEKKDVKIYLDFEKQFITNLEEVLKQANSKNFSEEIKSKIGRLEKELDFIKKSEAFTRLLFEDERYDDLMKFLANHDKEIEEELRGSRKRQLEAIDKIYQNLRTTPLDISSIPTGSRAKRGLRLNWAEKSVQIISSVENRREDVKNLMCALKTLKSNEIDKLDSCFEHVSVSSIITQGK